MTGMRNLAFTTGPILNNKTIMISDSMYSWLAMMSNLSTLLQNALVKVRNPHIPQSIANCLQVH